ncbi:MAG: DNA/RNA helicase [Deltaproteobacteria bacterium]|nr:DNA/RNA helicase [Deltaproteobacteria bacterium]
MNELEVRARLLAALEADLVGPFAAGDPSANPDDVARSTETLTLPPSRWYLTGFLAPQGARAPEADDLDSHGGELAAGSESSADDAGSEEPEPKRPVRFAASMGLSVYLPAGKGGADAIEVDVSYARYDKIEIALDRDDKKAHAWKRVPHGPVRVSVPLDAAALRKGIPVPLSAGLVIKGELRTTDMDGLDPGTRVLSLFLVNDGLALEKDRDLNYVFQVRLALHYAHGFCWRPNRKGEDAQADDDPRVLALLFRDRKEWAVGHNTSVLEPVRDPDGQVRSLRTTQIPRYEVPDVAHQPVPSLVLGMKELAKLDGIGLTRALSPLVEAYGVWLGKQRYAPLDRKALEETRDELVSKADRVKARIAEGIALLEKDAVVREAFTLANQAMYVAARQADQQREDKRYSDTKQPEWRPFQLAFVLMNLPSIADPAHADRGLADLIYFPTGGGKTEAYLGLIAFTLLLRRLRGKTRKDEGRGVAVILRYTLRLLTLDQLARASTLVCALEEIRTRNPAKLGNTRFTIGLWVGRTATANRLKEVHAALNEFGVGAKESPFPLTKCPWCGNDIRIENIKLVDDDGVISKTKYTRAVVYCDGQQCFFTEAKRAGQGLPVLFVDEQLYQELPDFLVATVDKFAMMPWRGEAGMLFGRATHLTGIRAYGVMHAPPKAALALPEGLLPPELIVQDELHLISGPLGTMVGLYESAVDYLAERTVDEVRRAPKVVCSTATARRAKEQIRALFGREMSLFPPRGIDEGDNFFARPAPLSEKPGRLYVGIGAPGRALRAVSVRTYATLLAAAQRSFDPKGEPKQPADPYMTLIGYFNSLRELGGMRRLVQDEVRNRVSQFGSDKRPHDWVGQHPWAANRDLRQPTELTSRVGSDELKRTKAELGIRHAAKAANALDVVLASNMISVGLDVDRLGLMVVTGQPKTTSEYIQATSRVGRAYPGLVVTCLNVMRPRDRSHYERFVAYHESFYRDVEATSVTPFSNQTLDRGLVGTLVSMIRHGVPGMGSPEGVNALHPNRPAAELLLEHLVRRARDHREWWDDDAEKRIQDHVRSRGRNFLDAWERVIAAALGGAGQRTYSPYDRSKHLGPALLYTATDDEPADTDAQKFEAPTSMRDVEATSHIWARFKSLDEK